jgi:hypothetical protein
MNLEYSRNRLFIVFLRNDNLASPMRILSLGNGKKLLNTWCFIMMAAFPVTTWSLEKGLSNGT